MNNKLLSLKATRLAPCALSTTGLITLLTVAPAMGEEDTWYGRTDVNEVRDIAATDVITILPATDPAAAPGLNVGTGEDQTGTLNLNGGSIAISTETGPADLNVGTSGGNGTLNMTGGDITWLAGASYGRVRIGSDAGSTGSFNQSGGIVTLDDGSYNLGIFSSTGTHTLSGSAVFNSGVTGYIGHGVGGSGLLELNDTATFNMLVGDVGLTVALGGASGTIRQNDSSTANFDHGAGVTIGSGAGSVGAYELIDGTLIMDAKKGLTLGSTAGATGSFTQSAGISTFKSAKVTVGGAGEGSFTVAGGEATVESSIEMGTAATGSGSLEVKAGGILKIGGTDGIRKGEGSAQFILSGGEVRVIGSALSTSLTPTLVNATVSTINTNGYNATFSGGLSGSGDLIKTGEGKLTVAGDTSSGLLAVEEGTAEFTGTELGFHTVDLLSGASLAATGDLTLAAGSVLNIEISSLTEFGTVVIDGQFNANGATLNIVFIDGYIPELGDSYDLFDFTLLTGDFAQVNIDAETNIEWNMAQFGSDGIIRLGAIPEPASVAMLAGVFALVLVASRRRHLRA